MVAPAVVAAAPQQFTSGIEQPQEGTYHPQPSTQVASKYQVSAETYARSLGTCAAMPRAKLLATGPGTETFQIACDKGEALIARCAFGTCHSMQ